MTAADGTDSGPDEEPSEPGMTLEELSAETGIPARTIRYYQAEKILQKPNRARSDARVARYTDEHVERLKLVAELRDRGLKLPAIRQLLQEGDASTRVADWLGLDSSLRGSWGHDEPRIVSASELSELLEGTPPGTQGLLEDAGFFSRQGQAWLVPSEPLLDVAAGLVRSGVDVDIVVEAVVENAKVKGIVLAETEKEINADAVLASNTSTISITQLAESLERPQNFCGMHFFNPVHAMPLVEVIRGAKTSDTAVARTVAYANKMGKKAVVVNDCPGFLVNRVLFPYFGGFNALMRDGADFQAVDKVMERWGWPMGPAYLMDVVGIDTGVHAAQVMAEGFPDRMQPDFKSVTEVLFENDRYGQKNGKGMYEYVTDKRGKPKKVVNDDIYELIAPVCGERTEFERDDIIARLMLPMAIETARCVEEGIVGTPAEADLALLYGVGFPPFRGGIFRWMDTVGLAHLAEASARFAHLGKAYELTEGMQDMLANGKTYY